MDYALYKNMRLFWYVLERKLDVEYIRDIGCVEKSMTNRFDGGF